MPKWPLKYDYGDRICVIGPSGSGKTTVLGSLCRQKGNVVVLDTKQDRKEKTWPKVGIPTDKLLGLKSGRYVWKASNGFITDPDEQSITFENLLHSGPRVVAIDEGYSVYDTRGLRLFVTQARGKDVSFIVGIQRPARVPLFLFTDANFWIVFGLVLNDDRKRVEQALGRKIDWDTLQKEAWSFFIFDTRGKCGGPYRLPKPIAPSVEKKAV